MRLSIIVCTRNRAHAITDCLDSLEQALNHAAPLAAEIVVVDNASTDETAAVVSTWAATSAWPVCLVYEAKQGLSAARNRGVAVAGGDLLVFTDDDCRLSPGYVREALAHDDADTGLTLRGGSVHLGDPDDLPLTIKTETGRENWSRARHSARTCNLGNSIFGCNMALRREVAARLGPFDECMGAGTAIPGGEDTDYVLRAYLADIVIDYVPDMAVMHFHGRKSPGGGHRLFVGYSRGSGALYAKHGLRDPNLCRQLVWDMKDALKEAFTRQNKFMPEIGFSYRDKVYHSLAGMAQYAVSRLKERIFAGNHAGKTVMDTQMDRLAAKLDICAAVLRGRLVYLDYPVHNNVGDLLIWKGTRAFFKRHQLPVSGQFSLNNIGPRARRALAVCDTICFHGGGNLGDLWPRHQTLREEIIAAYPHKRIVILPQSVHFASRRALDKATDIFRAHPDLHIFVRDLHSLATLEAKSVRNVQLCPDMAHALWGSVSAPAPTAPAPLYLFRRDQEAATLPPEAALYKEQSVDWDDLMTGFTARAYHLAQRIDLADGGKGRNRLPALGIWKAVSDLLIRRGVSLFAPHQTIVTNRLHAAILAALLQRECVIYDNSYGKISTYFDCWLRGVPGLELRRPEEEAAAVAMALGQAG